MTKKTKNPTPEVGNYKDPSEAPKAPIGQLCLRDGLPLSSARFSRQQIMQQGAFSGRCKSACLMFTHGCLWPVNKHKAPIKVVPSMQESQERLSDSVKEQSF